MKLSPPIFGRFKRAIRAAGKELGMVNDQPISLPTSNDFRGGFFTFQRKLDPTEIRFILEGAAAGNFNLQWDLFSLMEDSWPRLAKNLAELRRSAARATYTVQPFTERGAKPTASAIERALLVEHALRNWSPRPGTLELSFEDTLFHALDAYGKGISVLELQWQSRNAGILPRCSHLLSQRRYGWNPDGTELGLITTPGSLPLSALTDPNSMSTSWQPFPPDHFLVGIWQARTGAPGATAVLRTLAPFWAGITYGWDWLMSTAQLFGVPFRWATFDKNQPGLGAQLSQMLADMGASGYGAFPDGTKLEFKEAVTSARDNPQVILHEMADKACDLVILGQELSGGAQKAGLGGGASSLQEEVRTDRLQAVSQWCADLLNYQLVPAVLRANYGEVDEVPTIVPDVDDEPDPLKLAQRDQILLASGVDLPRSWLYERHGIPEPMDGEEIVSGRPALATPPAGAPGQAEPDDDESPEQVSAKAAGRSAISSALDLQRLGKAQAEALQPLVARLRAIDAIEDEAEQQKALAKLKADLPALYAKISADPRLAATFEEIIGTALVGGAIEGAKSRGTPAAKPKP